MRAVVDVSDVFCAQRIDLDSTSWRSTMRDVIGFFSGVVVVMCQLAKVIISQDSSITVLLQVFDTM